jgi:hypothetical protein
MERDMNLITTSQRVTYLAERTRDAYSFSAYGLSGWRGAIRVLLTHGLTDQEIEAVMRSKWTRWAGDGSTKRYGHFTGRDLARFMNSGDGRAWREVAQLTQETFGDFVMKGTV